MAAPQMIMKQDMLMAAPQMIMKQDMLMAAPQMIMKQDMLIISKLKSLQEQELISPELITPTITPTITTSITPPPKPPVGGGWGIPLPLFPSFPSFPSMRLGEKGPVRKFGTMPKQFVGSSYAAKVFDIRSGKEAKGTFGGMFTGLEIKPLDLSGGARIRRKGTKPKKTKKRKKR